MPRLDVLTGLRWWAAFWVFAYHLRALINIPAPLLWPIEYGYLGVTFFFVLSGFVLTWSRSATLPVSTFYTRRFARIWPSHMVALVLAIPVFYTLSAYSANSWVKPFDPGVIALSVPLLQGWSRDPMILFSGNPAAWTLTCELFFYALHPLLSRGLARLTYRGALWVAVGALVVSVAYRIACIEDPTVWWATSMPWPIVTLPQFVLGMALAWALRMGWRPRLRLWPAVGAFGIGLALVSVVPKLAPDSAVVRALLPFTNELITALCGVVIVGAVVTTLQSRSTWLGSGVMTRLGAWSYAFYLVHATVIYAALNQLGPVVGRWQSIGWTVVVFGAALALAYGLHRWVEFPAEARIRRWKAERDARSLEAADAE